MATIQDHTWLIINVLVESDRNTTINALSFITVNATILSHNMYDLKINHSFKITKSPCLHNPIAYIQDHICHIIYGLKRIRQHNKY